MYEVMQIRAASWAAMIKQRNHSGLTIREWCADDGNQESVYYYRLNRLRKMALDVSETPDPSLKEVPVSELFAQILAAAAPDSKAAIRIRRGDTVVVVSDDAPDGILSFLKEVMHPKNEQIRLYLPLTKDGIVFSQVLAMEHLRSEEWKCPKQ
ncbi:IS66 family insertion sequence element accessory protein TnpB [Clostridium sp. MCC353]|uniref:IS66 family insertion sequence element accessory protein TnpA n=1 Tax=Clostridium sp. MCC353 TaxID=2592646 RepID=UPI002079F796|nr:IS66 family insertion sequence element accessory protein TnpB [Clostridium sp. MCC353]